MDQSTIQEGKTIAIISYLTIIGLIIAYFMNNKKNAYANFHIGQSLRLAIFAIILSIVVRVLVSITGIGALSYLSYVAIVLLVLGLVNAIGGKTTPLPLIGTIGK